MGVIIFILSFIIAYKLCKIINRNTIGTFSAYLARGIFVWAIVLAILAIIANQIGLI